MESDGLISILNSITKPIVIVRELPTMEINVILVSRIKEIKMMIRGITDRSLSLSNGRSVDVNIKRYIDQ